VAVPAVSVGSGVAEGEAPSELPGSSLPHVGSGVGESVGESVGLAVAESVGVGVSVVQPGSVGSLLVGGVVGEVDGSLLVGGVVDAPPLGLVVGLEEAGELGATVPLTLFVGDGDGEAVPEADGAGVAVFVGEGVGDVDGLSAGLAEPVRSGTVTVPPCRKCSYQAITRFR
jgi:hypothetical protein